MSGYFVYDCSLWVLIFFFKQKTAYEMRISDWSSDVCSSDLSPALPSVAAGYRAGPAGEFRLGGTDRWQDADCGWPGADVSVLFLRDAYHSGGNRPADRPCPAARIRRRARLRPHDQPRHRAWPDLWRRGARHPPAALRASQLPPTTPP